jgi:hypothetical protein
MNSFIIDKTEYEKIMNYANSNTRFYYLYSLKRKPYTNDILNDFIKTHNIVNIHEAMKYGLYITEIGEFKILEQSHKQYINVVKDDKIIYRIKRQELIKELGLSTSLFEEIDDIDTNKIILFFTTKLRELKLKRIIKNKI